MHHLRFSPRDRVERTDRKRNAPRQSVLRLRSIPGRACATRTQESASLAIGSCAGARLFPRGSAKFGSDISINNKAMKSKVWFETWWWSPQQGTWQVWRSHETREAAEKACKRVQSGQPYLNFQIRKVRFVKYIDAKNKTYDNPRKTHAVC